jgi:hypothetical protein
MRLETWGRTKAARHSRSPSVPSRAHGSPHAAEDVDPRPAAPQDSVRNCHLVARPWLGPPAPGETGRTANGRPTVQGTRCAIRVCDGLRSRLRHKLLRSRRGIGVVSLAGFRSTAAERSRRDCRTLLKASHRVGDRILPEHFEASLDTPEWPCLETSLSLCDRLADFASGQKTASTEPDVPGRIRGNAGRLGVVPGVLDGVTSRMRAFATRRIIATAEPNSSLLAEVAEKERALTDAVRARDEAIAAMHHAQRFPWKYLGSAWAWHKQKQARRRRRRG